MKRSLLPSIITSLWSQASLRTRPPINKIGFRCYAARRAEPVAVGTDHDAQVVKDALYRVQQVNDMPLHVRESLLEFKVDGKSLGKVRPAVAQLLCKECVNGQPVFDICEEEQGGSFVTLAECVGHTFEQRSTAVAQAMEQLRNAGYVQGWRSELYPIKTRFHDPAIFAMERAAVPLIGATEYGVHINGLVNIDGETRMWIARRSKTKSKYPGMLDHIVAGGVPDGISLMENVVKECMEEAGIPEELVRGNVHSAGAISYETYSVQSDTVTCAVLFCYDLTLPESFIPVPVDGEVEAFCLMTMAEVKATLAEDYCDPVKPNCYSVIIDYLVREGHLSPECPGYLEIVNELRSGHCS